MQTPEAAAAETKAKAETNVAAAGQGFHASAGMWRTLPSETWSGPTGCAKWDQRTLAGHIVGEAV
jgi:hypothetical protein